MGNSHQGSQSSRNNSSFPTSNDSSPRGSDVNQRYAYHDEEIELLEQPRKLQKTEAWQQEDTDPAENLHHGDPKSPEIVFSKVACFPSTLYPENFENFENQTLRDHQEFMAAAAEKVSSNEFRWLVKRFEQDLTLSLTSLLDSGLGIQSPPLSDLQRQSNTCLSNPDSEIGNLDMNSSTDGQHLTSSSILNMFDRTIEHIESDRRTVLQQSGVLSEKPLIPSARKEEKYNAILARLKKKKEEMGEK